MGLDDILAEHAIRRQLVAVARAMDAGDWETLGAAFAPDITADFGTGEIAGRDNVIALIRSYLDNCGTTQHLLGNILVDIDGDTATSEAYVADMHLSRQAGSDLSFRTLGNYSDTWKKDGEEWLLVRRIKDNRAIVGSMDVFNP